MSQRADVNALAVLVSAPKPTDLGITFVDWNPMPPDKVMGLYRPVTLVATGPLALRHPQVVTKLNSPANNRAELTVKVFATNATKAPVTGTLKGTAAGVAFQKDVALAAGETREIAIRTEGRRAAWRWRTRGSGGRRSTASPRCTTWTSRLR